MCGIMAIINKDWSTNLNVASETILKQLMYVGALRGFDSTGLFKITKDHKTAYIKKAAPASWFLSQKPVQDFINEYYKDSFAVIAHNRKATMGKVDDQTAHPFREGPITLVHNGTLNYWTRTTDTLSDSHYITKELAKENKEFKPLESFKGAYALIWHNAQKKQINFCRNEERPLWLIEAKNWYILVSEREMGEWILLRNGHDVLDAIEIDAGYIYKMSWKNKLHITKIKFTPAKKWFETKTIHHYHGNNLEENDDDFGTVGMGSIGGDTHRRTRPSYVPQVSEVIPFNKSKELPKDLPIVTDLIIIPHRAHRITTTYGGSTIYSGHGIKEERYEVEGKIVLPFSHLDLPFKYTIKQDEWDFKSIGKEHEAIYSYRDGSNTFIHVHSVKLKKEPTTEKIILPKDFEDPLEEDDPVGALTDGASELVVYSKNHYQIDDSNWDDLCDCKCRLCGAEFDVDSIHEAIVHEKIQTSPLEISYTYICPDCTESLEKKGRISAANLGEEFKPLNFTLPDTPAKILTLPDKSKQVIQPAVTND